MRNPNKRNPLNNSIDNSSIIEGQGGRAKEKKNFGPLPKEKKEKKLLVIYIYRVRERSVLLSFKNLEPFPLN